MTISTTCASPTLSSFILILWHLSYSRTIRCAYIYRTKVDIRAAFVCVFKRDARARALVGRSRGPCVYMSTCA